MGNSLQGYRDRRLVQGSQQKKAGEYVSEFKCQICFETVTSITRFRNSGLCTHDFCLQCIAKHIQVQVESRTGNIACPGIGCKHALDPISCRSMISESLFLAWCDRLCDSLVLGLDHCYCPNPRCSAVILDECRNKKLIRINCPNCQRDICFHCKIPWHAGYKCSETDLIRDTNDVLAGILIERNGWTRCHRCGHSIERTGGCATISCRCGARFCHYCGGGRKYYGFCRHNIDEIAFLLSCMTVGLMMACLVFYAAAVIIGVIKITRRW